MIYWAWIIILNWGGEDVKKHSWFVNYLIFLVKAWLTRDILTHNIAIKRYCNKKIFLSHGFQWLTKVNSYQNLKYFDLWFVKSLPRLVIEIHGSKISFIALSFYLFITILCAKMSLVNKAKVRYYFKIAPKLQRSFFSLWLIIRKKFYGSFTFSF